MESSAMTPLHKQRENLSLDLPLPALMRRQVFLFLSSFDARGLKRGEGGGCEINHLLYEKESKSHHVFLLVMFHTL